MKRNTTRNIVLTALFSALMFVVTRFIQIPYPSMAGYFHFGDMFIFVAAFIVSPISGGLVGALGGAMADGTSGFAQYMPFTVVIKFLMGVVAGSLFNLFKNKKGLRFLGVLIAVFINAAGYFFTDWLMFSWQGAVGALLPNLLQGTIGMILTVILFKSTKDFRIFKVTYKDNCKEETK